MARRRSRGARGAVGMIGVSWGGFAALQAAARNPPALRGDRPDPRVRRPLRRRRALLRRLRAGHRHGALVDLHGRLRRASRPTPPSWGTAGARRGASASSGWSRGPRRGSPTSAATTTGARARPASAMPTIACPVFAVGGWSDGYRDMVLRMVEHVRAPVRGLIGPWGHTGPEARRARSRDRLPAGVRALLRPRAQGRGERVLRRAGARELHAGADRAVTGCAERPGRWVADAGVAVGRTWRRCVLPLAGPARSMRALQLTGLEAGVWCGDGGPADGAGDQRPEDGSSICWDLDPLGGRGSELLGHAAVELELAADRPVAFVAVAALRRRPRRQLVADRARRAQPHPSRGARPRRPARAGRAA